MLCGDSLSIFFDEARVGAGPYTPPVGIGEQEPCRLQIPLLTSDLAELF